MRNQKRNVVMVFIFALILTLTGCVNKEKDDNKQGIVGEIVNSITGDNELGNTVTNLANSGYVAEEDGCLYIASSGKIYKMEGDNIKKLCEIEGNASVGYVNVSKEWVYFWGSSDKEAGVYKVKTDGSDFQRIISDERGWNDVWVIGDSIYYNYDYKVKKDGTEKTQIGEKRSPISNSFNIADGYMYYCEEKTEGEFGVFREKIDGTDLTEIYEGRTDSMIVDNGWIYFDGYDEGGLCKMKIDGTGFELLVETYMFGHALNIKNEWIYYGSTEGIFKIKTDGTENQMLYSPEECDVFADLNIIGDWFYYREYNPEDTEKDIIYRAKLDGSKHEVFLGAEERAEIEKTEGHEDENQENQEEKIVLNNTYRSQFADFNMVTFPIFEFDFPSTWNITEEVTKDNENVVISNDHGVTITFTNNLYAPVGSDAPGGSNVYMSRVEASKIDDSSFVPQRIQDSDPTYVGDFVVAKLKMTGELDMKKDTDFQEVDGRVSYAVIQESQLGEHDVRHPYSVAFGFTYGGGVSLIAEAPADGFTKEEEKAVIEILKSFKLAEQ